MSVRLRLQRFGAKKRPFYRMVAADQRSPRDGRFKEILGIYDPMSEPNVIDLKMDRVEYWLGVGAQPSESATHVIRMARESKGVLLADYVEGRRQSLADRRKAALQAPDAPKLQASAPANDSE
jgi:small subunit ribosomal protein S16